MPSRAPSPTHLWCVTLQDMGSFCCRTVGTERFEVGARHKPHTAIVKGGLFHGHLFTENTAPTTKKEIFNPTRLNFFLSRALISILGGHTTIMVLIKLVAKEVCTSLASMSFWWRRIIWKLSTIAFRRLSGLWTAAYGSKGISRLLKVRMQMQRSKLSALCYSCKHHQVTWPPADPKLGASKPAHSDIAA